MTPLTRKFSHKPLIAIAGALTSLVTVAACNATSQTAAPAGEATVEVVAEGGIGQIDQAAFVESCVADLNWGLDTLIATVPDDMKTVVEGHDPMIHPEFWDHPDYVTDNSGLRDRFDGFVDGRLFASEFWYRSLYQQPEGTFVMRADRDKIPVYCQEAAANTPEEWPPSGAHPLPMPMSIPAVVSDDQYAGVAMDQAAGQCFQELSWGVELAIGGGRVWWIEPRFGTEDGRTEAVQYFNSRRVEGGLQFFTEGPLREEIANYCVDVTADLGHWPPAAERACT